MIRNHRGNMEITGDQGANIVSLFFGRRERSPAAVVLLRHRLVAELRLLIGQLADCEFEIARHQQLHALAIKGMSWRRKGTGKRLCPSFPSCSTMIWVNTERVMSSLQPKTIQFGSSKIACSKIASIAIPPAGTVARKRLSPVLE